MIGLSTQEVLGLTGIKCAIGHCRTGGWNTGAIVFLCNNVTNSSSVTMTDERIRITSNGNITMTNELFVGGNTNLRITVLYSGNESSGIGLYFRHPMLTLHLENQNQQ